MNKVLFQCIKKKINQTNSNIELEVEKILKYLRKETINNIEDVREIQAFIKNMDKEMAVIRSHIEDVMDKMGLLEEY